MRLKIRQELVAAAGKNRIVRRAHGSGGIQTPGAPEDGEALEEALQLRREQPVAPIDGRAESAVLIGAIAGPPRFPVQELIEASQHLRGREHVGAGGHHLDGQRNAIQTRTQRRENRGIAGPHLEIRAHGLRAVHEETDAGALDELLGEFLIVGHRQWRHEELALAGKRQRPPRSDQASQRVEAVEEPSNHPTPLLHQLLEAVQHQQRRRLCQCRHHLVERVYAGGMRQLQHVEERIGKRRGVGGIAQRNEPDGVAELAPEASGHLDGQARFPAAAGARQGHQARSRREEQGVQARHLLLTPEEPGHAQRQLGGLGCLARSGGNAVVGIAT